MKITLSKHAGFCEGVKRAYEMIVEAVADPNVKKPIYVMGSLVHNNDVVKSLEEMGVRKIKVDRHLFKNLKQMSAKSRSVSGGKNEIGTLVITAHGMGPSIQEFCKKEKIDLLDTTCPRVIKVQRLAKVFSDKLHEVIVIGDKKHKEMQGISEWSGNTARIVEKVSDLKKMKFPSAKKITVLFQTTQNLDYTEIASSFFGNFCPNAKILNTICKATQYRQNEIKKIAEKNEAVVIIGSPESANSKRLWEIAKKINDKSYFIERADQIKKAWFLEAQKVGVAAGASTPVWIIEDVIQKLKTL